MSVVFDNKDLENISKKCHLSNIIIFESLRTGVHRKEFVIDIAVTGETILTLEDVLQVKMYFEKKFERTVDIIDLKNENINTLLKKRILNTGKSIYSSDENKSVQDFISPKAWYYRRNKFKETFGITEAERILREEEIEKGRQVGRAEILVTQLTIKFKNITNEDIQAIKKLSTEKLHNIGIKIFKIASLEELRTYFN